MKTSGFPDLTIRRATLADDELLAALGRRTFVDAFGAANHPEDMAAYVDRAFAREQIRAELQTLESWFLIAADPTLRSGQPLGYAQLWGGSREPSVSGPHPVELVRLYLEQWATGQRYGDGLMAACCQLALEEGYQTLWLGVWEHNPRARRFYQRWGFEPVGSHDFWLGRDRQRDLTLVRSLSDLSP